MSALHVELARASGVALDRVEAFAASPEYAVLASRVAQSADGLDVAAYALRAWAMSEDAEEEIPQCPGCGEESEEYCCACVDEMHREVVLIARYG